MRRWPNDGAASTTTERADPSIGCRERLSTDATPYSHMDCCLTHWPFKLTPIVQLTGYIKPNLLVTPNTPIVHPFPMRVIYKNDLAQGSAKRR